MKLKKRIISIIAVVITGSFLLQQSCRKIPEPVDHGKVNIFDECIPTGSDFTFEIVTYNLKGFPKAGNVTLAKVKDLINRINPDVIALQEVATEADFNDLIAELDGWEGRFYPVLNSIYNLAYLFKSSEITIDDSKTRMILRNDFYAFPRAPFEIYVTHKTLNISTYLINIHLKCCTDGVAQRTDAATKLDNYIKSTRLSDPVIILGDFNDIISGTTPATNVFYNFVSATDEYQFTDMNIAKGNSFYWSYPSWPSHIDHQLVTNELFSRVDTAMVLRPDRCYPEYFNNISDHRPLQLILK